MCFQISQNEKTPFQAIQTRTSKSGKIAIFPKGLVHGFGQKLTIFPSFFLRQYRPGKCVFRYSKTKKLVSQLLNKKSKKSKNCHFSKGVTLWFWSKIGHFYIFFFLGNIGQENVFYDILQRKDVFVSYKNKKFKKSKNCYFFQGVSPWFWSKIGHCSIFFFKGNIGQENVFQDILERKNAFLGYKNKNFKKWKNCHFSKGVSLWFWSKINHFSIVFF